MGKQILTHPNRGEAETSSKLEGITFILTWNNTPPAINSYNSFGNRRFPSGGPVFLFFYTTFKVSCSDFLRLTHWLHASSTSRHSRYTKPSLNCPGTIDCPLLKWRVAMLAHTHSLKHLHSLPSCLQMSLRSASFHSPPLLPIILYLSSASPLHHFFLVYLPPVLSIPLTPPFVRLLHITPSLWPLLSLLLFPLHSRDSLAQRTVLLSLCSLSLLSFFIYFILTFAVHVIQTTLKHFI